MKNSRIIENEKGSVLVVALIMLVLLTILGITATTTSNVELQIAGNERNYKRAFFIANAAIEHARADLADKLAIAHAQNISMGQTANLNWSFALDGVTVPDMNAATDVNDWGAGVQWFTDQPFDPPNAPAGYTYSVRVYNDGGNVADTATNDSNNIVIVEARVAGPNNVRACVAVRLSATATGESINSYSAQQGGGSPKNYSSEDLNKVNTEAADFGYKM
jgi:hypothetical protein